MGQGDPGSEHQGAVRPARIISGWADYAKQNGIGCEPGTIVKGGDGIDYNCQ